MKKTPEQMAQALYALLKENSKDCFDVSVELFEDHVSYEDQAGKIVIDFGNKLILVSGNIRDTFCVNTKQEVAELYVTDNTKSIRFFESSFGSQMAEVIEQYDTYEELKHRMESLSLFMYLDLDIVFC